MFYLVTDQNNKSWNGTQWGENVHHQDENSHFVTYNSLDVASYMYPFYEEIVNPKLWLISGENPQYFGGNFRTKFSLFPVFSIRNSV